jgi:hypothetical protein
VVLSRDEVARLLNATTCGEFGAFGIKSRPGCPSAASERQQLAQ